jgi:hypothetical protein
MTATSATLPAVEQFFTVKGTGKIFMMASSEQAIDIQTQKLHSFSKLTALEDVQIDELTDYDVRKKLKLSIIQWQTLRDHLISLSKTN